MKIKCKTQLINDLIREYCINNINNISYIKYREEINKLNPNISVIYSTSKNGECLIHYYDLKLEKFVTVI